VPELGVGVVVESDGADCRVVVVCDVEFAAIDTVSKVGEGEARGPLVGDASASHPVAGFV
jgi:hypothetical protein